MLRFHKAIQYNGHTQLCLENGSIHQLFRINLSNSQYQLFFFIKITQLNFGIIESVCIRFYSKIFRVKSIIFVKHLIIKVYA